jgi:hypothetical protein
MKMRQKSFSTLWNGYESEEAAKKARDIEYRKLHRQGIRVKRWVLRNQLKPYASFGVPDGRSCNVYKLDIYD